MSPGIVSTLTDEQNVQQLREQMLADQVRNEEAGRSRQPESLLAEVPQEEVIRLKPEDINPRKPEPLNPDADVIARVRGEENTDGQEIKAAAGVRSELEGADKTAGEQSRASRVIADLANSERDMPRCGISEFCRAACPFFVVKTRFGNMLSETDKRGDKMDTLLLPGQNPRAWAETM